MAYREAGEPRASLRAGNLLWQIYATRPTYWYSRENS